MGADSRREPAAGYERFFGLHQPPFSLAPDTRFLFQSASHAATFAQVTFALQRREPVIVVTGEIGAGKTLLCRTVVERLEARTFLSIVTDPMLGPEDLLRQVLQDFGIVSRDSARAAGATRHDLVRTLQDFLASLAALDAHAVIVIDEAQHALPEVLEQIRLVSNAHDDRGTMLQLVLAGQTEGLEQLLGRDELSQLKQRVSRYVRLEPLTAGEVARYIGHRLAVARERPSASALPGARDLAREIAAWERSNADLTFTPGVGNYQHSLLRF